MAQRLKGYFLFLHYYLVFVQKMSNARVESECNNASVVFTDWVVATPWVPGHLTHPYCTEQYTVNCTEQLTVNCTVHCTVNCTLYCTVLNIKLYQTFKVAGQNELFTEDHPPPCLLYIVTNTKFYTALNTILYTVLYITLHT